MSSHGENPLAVRDFGFLYEASRTLLGNFVDRWFRHYLGVVAENPTRDPHQARSLSLENVGLVHGLHPFTLLGQSTDARAGMGVTALGPPTAPRDAGWTPVEHQALLPPGRTRPSAHATIGAEAPTISGANRPQQALDGALAVDGRDHPRLRIAELRAFRRCMEQGSEVVRGVSHGRVVHELVQVVP